MGGWNLLILIGVMVFAGAFGGCVNFLQRRVPLSRRNTGLSEEDESLVTSMAVGILAALLIPLFLKTIESDLLKSMPSATNLLVFAGLCLLAAYSSKLFIKSLEQKVLQAEKKVTEIQAEVVQKAHEVKLATKQVQEVEEQFTEDEPDKREVVSVPHAPLSPEEVKILDALTGKRFVLRTIKGVAYETRIAWPKVERLLPGIEKRGLIQILNRPQGKRLSITAEGRAYVLSRSQS